MSTAGRFCLLAAGLLSAGGGVCSRLAANGRLRLTVVQGVWRAALQVTAGSKLLCSLLWAAWVGLVGFVSISLDYEIKTTNFFYFVEYLISWIFSKLLGLRVFYFVECLVSFIFSTHFMLIVLFLLGTETWHLHRILHQLWSVLDHEFTVNLICSWSSYWILREFVLRGILTLHVSYTKIIVIRILRNNIKSSFTLTAHNGVLIFIVKLFQYISYTDNYSSSCPMSLKLVSTLSTEFIK